MFSYQKMLKDGDRLPVPWIADAPARKGEWASFDPQAKEESFESSHMLCQVCGEELGEIKVFGVFGDPENYRTSGPGMHPKCAKIACNYCPHLKILVEMGRPVVFIYTGTGNGLATGALQGESLELYVHPGAIISTYEELKNV
jgi:hypothetical protein